MIMSLSMSYTEFCISHNFHLEYEWSRAKRRVWDL